MKDRIPTYPGRVSLVPVAGMANIYTLAWADEPTQFGTPLNKAAFLPDELAAFMGLEQADPVVADALRRLMERLLVTCEVFVGENAPTLATPGKVGDEYIQQTAENAVSLWKLTAVQDGSYVWIEYMRMGHTMETVTFTASTTWSMPDGFDKDKDVSILCVGGGGGGGAENGAQGGGGGGYIRRYTGKLTSASYTVSIGAGGEPGSAGGTSSFGTLVSAPGGGAGSVNGGSGGTGGGADERGRGGDGEYGGGGGGGADYNTNTYGGAQGGDGGNGGTYGGGGGGAGAQVGSTQGSVPAASVGGNSAAYTGGTGYLFESGSYTYDYASGGGGAGYAENGNVADGGSGINTTGMNLEYTGTGQAGGADGGSHTGGAGGGGYGGNGGTVTSMGGAGGGGYGADGGDSIGSAATIPMGCGGGGGGWGGPGLAGTSEAGGGGGGYSPANIGAGGSGGSAGKDGIVILSYYTYYANIVG